ncbi:leucyl aminopeptidase [Rhodobacter aestuarii]|uniref:Probable cytosol aminopeptidase n=1 Tax=Rhodobacter aestuarii TaxID=453582 RepID=A0A1N7M6I5_9RHOB|nr:MULTISPECIES: leucyl aminopeptidase [Rhodobacter]PTV94881.1 leucyl aminopeptidase [Rhodobacter aestuarii]SIS81715.1 leucyl aminopeptidase [Rhodobacter aestuarii]SOC13988.1 leucyl aminopeptidase [Rhodobacter sp. JA431]
MIHPVALRFEAPDADALAAREGRLALIVPAEGKLGPMGRKLDRLTRGAVGRALASESWEKLGAGDALDLGFPGGLACESLALIKLDKKAAEADAQKAGACVAKRLTEKGALIVAENHPRAAAIAFGLALRAYRFDYHSEEKKPFGPVTLMVTNPEAVAAEAAPHAALAEGVFFTRDLVNEPANILTTDDFAARLAAMHELGLEVEILDEDELEQLGFRALLAVGQGSESPSKVVVMRWNGGEADAAPLALVGKGVCFDTGGISIKPAAGMEEMTMDMGGAAVVSGVMRTLALRKARANVVGIVGLVENMPDGRAQRPGDIVKSLKGDTIEVINTDAEGRMVLADALWYAQDRFQPAAVIDLATLTGAIIVALGHEHAGLFTNDEKLSGNVLEAAKQVGEGVWPMPLTPAYDPLIKSRLADIKNTGGRWGGSITAAAFLKRFVQDDVPWCHIDIAGVALPPGETTLAPKGATGWGVMTLDRLIRNKYES